MSYQYSQKAKERISSLGQSEIINFIGEVSPALRRQIFGVLPKVPGFREGHLTEIKEKQKKLIGYMLQTHSSPEEIYAWKNFSLFWQCWAEEHIGKPFKICEGSELEVNSGSTFLRKLAKVFPKVSRENAERLFIFSKFADDSEVAAALEIFRPEIILARDNVIDTLPIRLDELEGRIELTEMNSKKNDDSIKHLESNIDAFAEKIRIYSNDANHKFKLISELQNLLNSEVKRTDSIKKATDELYRFKKNNELITSTFKEKIELNTLAIDEIFEHEKMLKIMANEIAQLQESLIVLRESELKYSELANDNAYEKLSERIDKLEANISQTGTGFLTNHFAKFHEVTLTEKYECLSTHEDIFNIITSNLQAVGLTKGSSDTVARLALATFLSGQIIQFCGSLADIVADAIATAIGAPNYHVWKVPVGLISDTDAFFFVESIAESSRCLVLKGTNLSAFEIYGTAIRDLIVQRQLYSTNYDHLALIATWKLGPAAFPDGGMLAELGPVIDTDSLKMRGLSAILPKLKFGCIVEDKWSDIGGLQTDSVNEYIDELREVLDEIGFDGGVLWRRMVHIFYTSLMKIPNGNYIYDLYSVLSFYALTWAKVKGGPVKEIEDIADRELKNHSEKISARG